MKNPARPLIGALPALLAAFTSMAQETGLSEVVVTAPKIEVPLNTTGVGAADLQSLRPATSDTASLLRNVPGMSLYGAGGVSSRPAIHGLADDRLRIKVDGMDLIAACANHMNAPLSYIDPSNVAGLKVFAGIVPVSLGGDSIGGTILANSPEPAFAAAGQGALVKGQAGAFFRSNGNARGANLSATLAGENLSVTYSGSTAESDNYEAAKKFKAGAAVTNNKNRDGHWLGGDEVASSYYKSVNQSLGLALRHENHLVDLKLGVQNIPYQGFPNQRMDMTDNDSTQVNLRYKGQFGWGALEARAYNEKTRHSMNFGRDKQYWYGMPATIPGMPMETKGNNTGALVRADVILTERDILRVGSELQWYRMDDWWPPSGGMMMGPNTFWNINDGERDRTALFAEWEARWTPEWLTLLGARGERVRMDAGRVQGYGGMMYVADANAFNARSHGRSDDNLDLTALARYTPDASRSFEFGFARKTRSPNLYERYAWSRTGMAMLMVNTAGDGNGYVGDLDLKPEVANILSATLDWHDPAREWEFKLTPYYSRVKDYIDAVRCVGSGAGMMAVCGGPANNTATTGFVYLKYANQSARFYGLDISGHVPLAKNTGFGSFTLAGMLNYVNGRNRTSDDDLYNIMPLNARLALSQKLGAWTNTLEVQLVRGKTDVSQVRNEVKTEGYGLVNLRSSYEWKQARLDVGIENLLDKFYSHPLGGAYVGQGMTMSGTGVPWGVTVPGMGRSVYAGLNVKF
jgi:iron complex outermembrane receptor protein